MVQVQCTERRLVHRAPEYEINCSLQQLLKIHMWNSLRIHSLNFSIIDVSRRGKQQCLRRPFSSPPRDLSSIHIALWFFVPTEHIYLHVLYLHCVLLPHVTYPLPSKSECLCLFYSMIFFKRHKKKSHNSQIWSSKKIFFDQTESYLFAVLFVVKNFIPSYIFWQIQKQEKQEIFGKN